MEAKTVALDLIEANRGQIIGLPANPRRIKKEKLELLKTSIQRNPEMLELRELIVVPRGGKYVIIGGNMRYRAMLELGYTSTPCKILPADTSAEKLRAYTLKDNGGYGEWDYDMLFESWDFEELTDSGIDLAAEWGDDNAVVKQPPKAWNSRRKAGESVCDMKENVSLYRRGELLFASFFKKSESGIPLSRIKTEENVPVFAEQAVRLLKGLVRLNDAGGWCLVTAPRRRHQDWNFAEAVCREISSRLGVPFLSGAVSAKNRHRVCPTFKLAVEPDAPNIIVFDDILTTGSTLKAINDLFPEKNVLNVVGINNN